MSGDASFPEIDDTASTVNGGHDDDVKSTVGSRVSAAKFVDNSIHHATYEISTHSSGRYMTVGRPSSSDFQATHERLYDFEEEGESLLLTHTTAPGVKDSVPVFFTDTRLETGTIAPLTLFAGSKKINPHSITTADKGSRVNLRNLKGKTLSQLGLTSSNTNLKAGQIVDVGLRTTDLVMRLFRGKTHSLNSISVGRPFSGPRTEEVTTYKGANLGQHSRRFLSANFISSTIPNTLRFVARHDNYTIYHDRFGNFIYAKEGFRIVDKEIDPIMSSNVSEDKVVDVANRVIVKGKKVAINDNNEVIVDDAELQKEQGVIKTAKVNDPLATTVTSARRSANQYLRLNRKAQGAILSKKHPSAWELYPGEIINYRDPISNTLTRRAIIEVEHSLHDSLSDFQLISYESGIERILLDYGSQLQSQSGDVIFDKMTRLTLGGGGRTNFNIHGSMMVKSIATKMARINSDPSGITLSNTGNDTHSGFLIGHRNYSSGDGAGRSAVGTGLTSRLTGGSHNSGTITVSSTTGFPSAGYLIINEAIHVQYTGKTGTTFTGVTVQAPSGASVPASGLSVRLFRTRGHEMRTVKSTGQRRSL